MTVVASGYERKANDLYETEAWAVAALLRVFPPKMGALLVWEPAAGNHAIVDVLECQGAAICATDIMEYDRPHDALFDFLSDAPVPGDIPLAALQAVITNPPYGKGNREAVAFARKALGRCPHCWVALLLTAKFDFGKTRMDLFRDSPRFFAKVALVDRIQWFAGEHGGTEDHAWFIWAPANYGPQTPCLLYEGRAA